MTLTPEQSIILRRWNNVNKNRAHAEELILKLMENPATDLTHLAQAHAMYSDLCKRLHELSHRVHNALLSTETKTKTETPKVTPKTATVVDVECSCGEKYRQIADGKWYRCPACGAL